MQINRDKPTPFNLPNALSVGRLTLVPVLFFLAWNGRPRIFLACLVASLSSDFLDGLLARALRRSTAADAVEMESRVIRALCRERGIPGATVRVISDAANEDLPLDFARLMDAGQNLRYGKLALALAKSPRKIGALFKLQSQTRAAAEKLAQVLVNVLARFPP